MKTTMDSGLLSNILLLIMIAISSIHCVAVIDEADQGQLEISVDESDLKALVHRVRRQSTGNKKNSLTQDERVEFLKIHNSLRSSTTTATDMLKMYWNGGLESMAQEWSNQCNFKHGNPSRQNPPFSPIGQNMYATSGVNNVTAAVQSWFNEITDYTYDTMVCTPQKQCGHYTQVVWSKSYAVGCGITLCSSLGSTSLSNAYFVVCNYGPAGNYKDVKPYRVGGSQCSACPANKTSCDSGLCRAQNECSVITECTPKDTSTCLCDESFYMTAAGPSCFRSQLTWLSAVIAALAMASNVHLL